MAELAPEDLADRLEDGDSQPLILDIRHEDEFESWHIPDSVNIDVYDTLKESPEQAQSALETLPQDKEIVTVCAAGAVSDTATTVLTDLGYEASTLEEGMRGWSRVHLAAELPTTGPEQLLQVARPGTGCLSYVLIDDGEAVVVDPSQYTQNYLDLIDAHGATLTAVLETHAHADHISGAQELAETHDIPHYLHRADAGALTSITTLTDGQVLSIGSFEIEAIHTPGHTEGSVTFNVDGETLLTGDTLFLESVGRPDLEGGNEEAIRGRTQTLFNSLQRILGQSDDLLVLPAHDPGAPEPPTTASLHDVREHNEVLEYDQEGFVEAITANIPETPPNHEQIKRVNTGKENVEDEEARQLELGPNQCAAN
ncbi:MBL fold metallo-hydrolase [Haladaptatus salinisoli]|uniref:MBL fold metallo-hydrolase n=1 Tax=Haladaptatus salinisoli TaxID=2884876 RepID=UPI001D09F4DA|nr:MBL fold metallo-hydrolase [Haladaptatus salinisoli]